MTPETEELLDRVVAALQREIGSGQCPAVVAVGGTPPLVLTDYDYQRDEVTAQGFERRAAARVSEAGATRWVLAVPQVWLIASNVVSVRAVSNLPLREGESEAITWMAVDLSEGVDYGRVRFTRDPGGAPVFGDIEVIAVQARPAPGMPGYAMLQLIARDETTSDSIEPGDDPLDGV
jgi:hypothetical protein